MLTGRHLLTPTRAGRREVLTGASGCRDLRGFNEAIKKKLLQYQPQRSFLNPLQWTSPASLQTAGLSLLRALKPQIYRRGLDGSALLV